MGRMRVKVWMCVTSFYVTNESLYFSLRKGHLQPSQIQTTCAPLWAPIIISSLKPQVD